MHHPLHYGPVTVHDRLVPRRELLLAETQHDVHIQGWLKRWGIGFMRSLLLQHKSTY